jgi:hypothetical protein
MAPKMDKTLTYEAAMGLVDYKVVVKCIEVT